MGRWHRTEHRPCLRRGHAHGALLSFEEADSLLSDRRGAEWSWEVSKGNEMLTWMESHPLPVVCTTNFAERLDLATQRRFTFRNHDEVMALIRNRRLFSLGIGYVDAHMIAATLLAPGTTFGTGDHRLKEATRHINPFWEA